MRMLNALRVIRACALALWLGCSLAMLGAILLVLRYTGGDELRACEVVTMLTAAAGSVRLLAGLAALGAQAGVFYSRAPEAPAGWRRSVPAILVAAALAAAVVSAFWLAPQTVVSHAGPGATHVAHARFLIPVRALVMLGVEAFVVLAALIAGFVDVKR